jgi:tetratricopeptide (TPR) repeat protein
MKKTILLFAIVLMAIPVLSQGKKYTKTMRKAIEMCADASDRQSAIKCASAFEDISESYSEQWLPHYYAAEVLITNSFEERELKLKDEMLDRAWANLDKARELAPKESEIEVMKAMYYFSMMSADPETRGPMYYQDAFLSIENAKNMNPENPRAHYLDGVMALNMPDFMGGGPHAAKPLFLKAAEKFESYKNEDPLWPDWGADLVIEELDKMKDINSE